MLAVGRGGRPELLVGDAEIVIEVLTGLLGRAAVGEDGDVEQGGLVSEPGRSDGEVAVALVGVVGELLGVLGEVIYVLEVVGGASEAVTSSQPLDKMRTQPVPT